jgi:hypothetical protein
MGLSETSLGRLFLRQRWLSVLVAIIGVSVGLGTMFGMPLHSLIDFEIYVFVLSFWHPCIFSRNEATRWPDQRFPFFSSPERFPLDPDLMFRRFIT